MTPEEIMQMVDEAGFEHKNHLKYRGRYNKCTVPEKFEIDCFERFATLARADLVEAHEGCKSANTMLLYEVDAIAAIKQERDALKSQLDDYTMIMSSKCAALEAEIERLTEQCKLCIEARVIPLYPVAPQAVPAWLPIESAPHSADPVLALSESGNMKIETGYWLVNLLQASKVDDENCNYTHWMPLPAAPAVKETE
jgi:hypothetical protein